MNKHATRLQLKHNYVIKKQKRELNDKLMS